MYLNAICLHSDTYWSWLAIAFNANISDNWLVLGELPSRPKLSYLWQRLLQDAIRLKHALLQFTRC